MTKKVRSLSLEESFEVNTEKAEKSKKKLLQNLKARLRIINSMIRKLTGKKKSKKTKKS